MSRKPRPATSKNVPAVRRTRPMRKPIEKPFVGTALVSSQATLRASRQTRPVMRSVAGPYPDASLVGEIVLHGATKRPNGTPRSHGALGVWRACERLVRHPSLICWRRLRRRLRRRDCWALVTHQRGLEGLELGMLMRPRYVGPRPEALSPRSAAAAMSPVRTASCASHGRRTIGGGPSSSTWPTASRAHSASGPRPRDQGGLDRRPGQQRAEA